MPGPVSDSYDPEFGTGENAADIRAAVLAVRQRVTDIIGSDRLRDIVAVAHGDAGPRTRANLTEREWRIIRFCLSRFAEE